MRSARFLAAPLVLLVANAFLFANFAWNRSGAPTAEITFNQCELFAQSGSIYRAGAGPRYLRLRSESAEFGQPHVSEFGFEISKEKRGHAKPAWVAIEHDGAAWKEFISKNSGRSYYSIPKHRLVVIGIGHTPSALREQFPDRSKVAIVRGVLQRRLIHESYKRPTKPAEPAILLARQEDTTLPIPSRFRGIFRKIDEVVKAERQRYADKEETAPLCVPTHQIVVKWGRNHEAWLDEVRQIPEG